MIPNVLGLAGSLRREAYSKALLRVLTEAAYERDVAKISEGAIDLPLYNQDLERGELPDSVARFKQAVTDSDALLIVTPEYNHSIPGALKNALDWASRPGGASPLLDKPVLVVSVSPAFTGGVRAHAHLHDVLLACGARIAPGPQVVIGGAAAKVREGTFVDVANVDFGIAAIERMLADRR
jgi:chromate reductase, NAD(P)H dehydrogenase (quinone)